MKIITILSGKGGTGKSSITASLALVIARKKKIICADCDVDAANLALVFGIKESDFKEWTSLSAAQKAEFDYEKCNNCKKCIDNCYFNAIDFKNNRPELKEFSCEGCGMCELVCPTKAIKLVDDNNAEIGYAETKYGFKIVSAQLKIGASGSGKVVAKVKGKTEKLAGGVEIALIDSAAGIGCPVIASVTGSDYCILVTEPTPLGLFDLQKAYDIVSHFNIACGIIINKFDINEEYYEKVKQFAQENNIKIIGRLPYDKSFVKALVRMTPVVLENKKLAKIFDNMADQLIKDI